MKYRVSFFLCLSKAVYRKESLQPLGQSWQLLYSGTRQKDILYHPVARLKGVLKIMENFWEDTLSAGRDLNPVSSKCDAGILGSQLWCYIILKRQKTVFQSHWIFTTQNNISGDFSIICANLLCAAPDLSMSNQAVRCQPPAKRALYQTRSRTINLIK